MEAIGTFSVKCNKCSTQHDFTEDDVYFDIDSTIEREMGVENEYLWDEDSFICNVCNNIIEIEYHVWEYPVGIFNHDDIKVSGATPLNRFEYEFNDDEDNYEEEL